METFIKLFSELDAVAYGIIAAIGAVFALGLLMGLRLRAEYGLLRQKLKNGQKRENGTFDEPILDAIVTEYAVAVSVNGGDVNTCAIVDKVTNNKLRHLRRCERFLKNAPSIMVILGLLGTFCGLTMSVGELSVLLAQTGTEDWMSLLDKAGSGLLESLAGMATAFSTSLVGIACSMLMTTAGTLINAEGVSEEFAVEMEDYLDNVFYNYISDDFKKKDDRLYAAVNKALGDFGDRMEKIIARYSLTPARAGRMKNEIA